MVIRPSWWALPGWIIIIFVFIPLTAFMFGYTTKETWLEEHKGEKRLEESYDSACMEELSECRMDLIECDNHWGYLKQIDCLEYCCGTEFWEEEEERE